MLLILCLTTFINCWKDSKYLTIFMTLKTRAILNTLANLNTLVAERKPAPELIKTSNIEINAIKPSNTL